jgi:predicted RNA-binding protein (virulence factor B family)
MVEIGKMNSLKVVKEVDFGVYLDGEELGEILLPKRYVTRECLPGNIIDCFIYFDSEDRIIATSKKPLAVAGEFAFLKVVNVNKIGAFMDWGLMKDLLVPFNEQNKKLEEGKSYVVFIYVDEEKRGIVGSAKVEDFLDNEPHDYTEGQEVDLLIYGQSDMGYKAIINNNHSGIIYKNEVFRPIAVGDKLKGYIKKIREDKKIDLIIDKPGYAKVGDISTQIIDKLKASDGYLALSDKSPAEEIYNMFGVSKKTFKKAIGGLYKNRLLTIEGDGIRLAKPKK